MWLKFLRLIDRRTPKHLSLHLIVDNYAPHSHPDVRKWLARHPRFVMHFTPTGASWLDMVERFFRDITDKRSRRDSFTSVAELELAIEVRDQREATNFMTEFSICRASARSIERSPSGKTTTAMRRGRHRAGASPRGASGLSERRGARLRR